MRRKSITWKEAQALARKFVGWVDAHPFHEWDDSTLAAYAPEGWKLGDGPEITRVTVANVTAILRRRMVRR